MAQETKGRVMAKVMTTHGEMDERDLVKFEYPDSSGAWIVEYYVDKVLVHRSVTVQLTGVQAVGEAADLG